MLDLIEVTSDIIMSIGRKDFCQKASMFHQTLKVKERICLYCSELVVFE